MRTYMSDVLHDYEFVKMHPDHLDSVYNLYVQNNSFVDENIGRRILSAERDYAYDNFLSILQDDKVFGFIVNQRVPFQEFNEYIGYYNEDIIYVPLLKGFLVYEIIPPKYSILFIETEDKQGEFYKELLNHLKEKLRAGDKCTKIDIEIFDDGNYDKMKVMQQNGFKEKSLIRAQKGPDSFIFEYTLDRAK